MQDPIEVMRGGFQFPGRMPVMTRLTVCTMKKAHRENFDAYAEEHGRCSYTQTVRSSPDPKPHFQHPFDELRRHTIRQHLPVLPVVSESISRLASAA